MAKTKNNLLSLSILLVLVATLDIGNGQLISGPFGVSSGTATVVVNALDNCFPVATVMTAFGVLTGVGTIESGVAASILTILKKQKKAKAAAF